MVRKEYPAEKGWAEYHYIDAWNAGWLDAGERL